MRLALNPGFHLHGCKDTARRERIRPELSEMHFGTAFRIIDSNLTHLLVLSIYYYTSPFDNPSSTFSFNFKSAALRTSNLVSVDLLDVLDRLALQVLGVDLL